MMSRMLRWGMLAGMLILASGCDVNSVRSDTLSRFPYGSHQSDVDAAIAGKALYTLDYLVDGHIYRFQTVYSGDLGRYFGLLFEDGILVSMIPQTEEDAYWSRLRGCTLFPPEPSFDSVGCMRGFSDEVRKLGATYPAELSVPDEAGRASKNHETTGDLAEGAMFAPLWIPVALVALPVMAASSAAESSTKAKIKIKLGDKYDDIRPFVAALPEGTHQVLSGSGSFYVPGGIYSAPVVAFGIQDGIVVWMDQDPHWACSGSGENRCRLGH